MGQKLEGFLRVLASGLSPQAFQANVGLYNQEKAREFASAKEGRDIAREDAQQDYAQTLKQMGVYATIAKENPTNPKIQHEMGLKIREAAKGDTRLLNAAMGYILEDNSPPSELESLGGGPPSEEKLSTVFERARKDKIKGSAFSAIDEKGNQVMAVENEKGQIVDASTFEHKPEWTKAPTKQETGVPGSFTKSQAGKVKLKGIEGEQSVAKNVIEIDNLIKTMSSEDFIGGVAGQAIQGLDSVVSQVQQLTGGQDFLREDGSINRDALDLSKKTISRLEKSSGQYGLASSQVLQLAYVIARANDPSGRLSDRDVKVAEDMLGDSANPRVRAKVLEDVQRRLINNYNIEQRIIAKSIGEKFIPLSLDGLRKAHSEKVKSDKNTRKENRRKRFEY